MRFIVMNEMHKRYNALHSKKYGLCGEGGGSVKGGGVLHIEGGGLGKGGWGVLGYRVDTHCQMAAQSGSSEHQNLGALSSFWGKDVGWSITN